MTILSSRTSITREIPSFILLRTLQEMSGRRVSSWHFSNILAVL